MMGASYTNITVRVSGTSRKQLIDYLDHKRVSAFVSPVVGRYILVYDEFGENTLAQDISRTLECMTFIVRNDNDDSLSYRLFENGVCLDSYDSSSSSPNASHCPLQPQRGDPAVLCRHFASPWSDRVELSLRRTCQIELDRHRELVEALNIPHFTVGVSYDDIERGELPTWMLSPSVLCQTPREPADSYVVLDADTDSSQQAVLLRSPLDLQQFSLRVLVALAARSAKRRTSRIDPDFPREERQTQRLIDKAIALAEAFAAGCAGDHQFRNQVVKIAGKCEENANRIQLLPHGSTSVASVLPVLISAHRTAIATLLCAVLQDSPPDSLEYEVNAEEAKKAAYEAIAAGLPTSSDFEALLMIAGTGTSSLGDPIDTSDVGPLGQL